MKRDQKGFTIVELLIAVAILSIVIASVCGFILVGSRSYAAGNSDISVQQEAQLALNQMSDVLIDTTRSVNYAGYDASGSPVFALKDAEFAFTPEDKSLIMYNGVLEETPAAVPGGASSQTVTAGNGNKHYHFYWSKADETLYYAELDVQAADVDTTSIHFPAFDPTDPGWVVLAGNVTDFSADLSQVEEKRVVQLSLTFLDGRKEYVTSNNVTIRNKVGVNDAELAALNRRKTLSVIPRDSGVIVEPNETYHFSTPKVTGENVSDRSVKWSVVSAGSPGTDFIDKDNGILKVASDEYGDSRGLGSIEVMITTNAVDSEGKQAFCKLEVYIKRAMTVSMAKINDSAGNGSTEISPGCTFTVTANVTGFKLGKVCSACGDDTSIDDCVVPGTERYQNSYNNQYVWEVWAPDPEDPTMSWWKPKEDIEILSGDEHSATFRVKDNIPDVGTHKYVIRSMSLLATQGNAHGRQYDGWVGGALELTVVKNNNKTGAKPMSGGLSYATDNEENLHNEMKLDVLKKEIRPGTGKYVPESTYVVCMHVVENSGQEGVRTLLYSMPGGADFRIAPDLLDLDLDNSYTFYMQALCPVSKDNLLYGDDHQVDSEETIWNEYWNNSSHEAPFDYYGDKYVYGDVYYGALDKPKAIWNYQGNTYEETDLTLDPVNIYMVPESDGILIGNIQPSAYKNIWHLDQTQKRMTYSVFVEGEGGSRKPVYTFNKAKEVMKYEGNRILGDGAGKIQLGDGPGQPTNPGEFMVTTKGGDRLKLCGKYHIVPGFCYENRVPDRNYKIIGWDGFSDCSYAPGKEFLLPRTLKYYEFSNSVIHVEITADFTMDINDDWFQGQVNFPLPQEIIKNSALFPNPYDTEWKNTAGSLRVEALKTGNSYGEYKTFAYAGYHYYPMLDRWEVEPFEVKFDTSAKKIYTHSYGTYVCDKNGSKWEKSWTKPSSTTEQDLICNVKPFWYNYYDGYQTFFPLPTDQGFPFANGVKEISYELECFDDNMQSKGTLSGLIVTCTQNGDEYEIEFLKEEGAPSWATNNHKITVTSYGTYTCRKGQTAWTRKKGYGTSFKTDLVTNLENVMIYGNAYKMYFPSPTDPVFPFTGSTTEFECTSAYLLYAMTDVYGENASEAQNLGVKVRYSYDDRTITLFSKWDGSQFGTFKWDDGAKCWTKVP